MTDKEALKYILEVADNFVGVFGEIPVDSIEHMAKHAGGQIICLVRALSLAPDTEDAVTSYATAIAGLILKLKAGSYARALLAAEEASNEST